ncbi:MAG: Mur ligase family protein [Streptococcaceae bacterium]|nr:Mur ligase family protein [Streptococcaceae bacterium]
MQMHASLAKILGKSVQWGLRTFFRKSGASLPGKLAIKVDPDILKFLAKDYEIIVVTGTNGKTLTTALTVNILRQQFDHILTNPTGSNMIQGIVSTFLEAKPSKTEKNFAVLEIDEASLSKVMKYIQPKLFVFTNIFRDQMDRYGEIYTTYQMLLDGTAQAPEAIVLCNGDSPIFHSTTMKNPQKYYGFDHLPDVEQLAHYNTEGVLCPNCQHILHYRMITYANLGNYYCPNCEFHRPKLDIRLSKLKKVTPVFSEFVVDEEEYRIEAGGMYNVYNALAAIAVAKHYQIDSKKIRKGLNIEKKVFGRQESILIDGKCINIILVKNPVGLNQVIDMLGLIASPFTLATLLNANYADGIDTSWIWDGNYEKLTKMSLSKVIAAGGRHQEMYRRLLVAGIQKENLIKAEHGFDQLLKEIKSAPTNKIYVLATYTAMLDLRKNFASAGFLKGGF